MELSVLWCQHPSTLAYLDFLLSGITRVLWETANKESSLFKDQFAAVYIFCGISQGRSVSINVGTEGLVRGYRIRLSYMFVNETNGLIAVNKKKYISEQPESVNFCSLLSINTIHLSLEIKTLVRRLYLILC